MPFPTVALCFIGEQLWMGAGIWVGSTPVESGLTGKPGYPASLGRTGKARCARRAEVLHKCWDLGGVSLKPWETSIGTSPQHKWGFLKESG